jgi:hypothetical protein
MSIWDIIFPKPPKPAKPTLSEKQVKTEENEVQVEAKKEDK